MVDSSNSLIARQHLQNDISDKNESEHKTSQEISTNISTLILAPHSADNEKVSEVVRERNASISISETPSIQHKRSTTIINLDNLPNDPEKLKELIISLQKHSDILAVDMIEYESMKKTLKQEVVEKAELSEQIRLCKKNSELDLLSKDEEINSLKEKISNLSKSTLEPNLENISVEAKLSDLKTQLEGQISENNILVCTLHLYYC